MRETYELYIQPERRKTYNTKNGQFLKGNVPHNKGKKWSQWMGKRAQKRAAKGWKNLDLHRPKTRPDTAGRCSIEVVAVRDDGTWSVFSSLSEAARRVGGCSTNISRCARLNRDGKRVKWGGTNNDHRYKGIRWYYEADDIWTTKIKG